MNILMSSEVSEIAQEQINEINGKFNQLKAHYDSFKAVDIKHEYYIADDKWTIDKLNDLRIKFCDNKQQFEDYVDSNKPAKRNIYDEFNRIYKDAMDNLITVEQIKEVIDKWSYIKDNYLLKLSSISLLVRYFQLFCVIRRRYEYFPERSPDGTIISLKYDIYGEFNKEYDRLIDKYDTKFYLAISDNNNLHFTIGPNFNGNIADNSVIPTVSEDLRDDDETVDDEGVIDDYGKSYMNYLDGNRKCTLVILNSNYRLTDAMLKGLSVLKICNMSILSDVKEIPKDLEIEVVVKHTDKLSDYLVLQKYLVKCFDDDAAIKKNNKDYKLTTTIIYDAKIDEFKYNNQYDIKYQYIRIDGDCIVRYDFSDNKQHHKDLDKLSNEYQKVLFGKCDWKYDLYINAISNKLYQVTSNKFLNEQIIDYYKEVMDLCISIVKKSFYSNINIVIDDIDLNVLLKDFVLPSNIVKISNLIDDFKKLLSKILIIDIEGEFSLLESYEKSVYVINPKAILTNKRIYVDSYFDYNASVFSDKAHDAYRKITEPTKSCCSKLFISSYDNIKNSVCDWVFIDYDNADLIKIIESRQSKVVDIIYQKDESEERKCELFIDICKRLKAVRDLPRVFAPTGLKHQSISIKNQMHWKIFAVCAFAVLLVIGFYYFNVNWSVLNAVVTYGIIVILFVVSMLIVYLIGRFDASHYYFYKVIYHIMSPFAEWDFNTFMVVCRHNNGLSIVSIAIIFIILFLLLFYFAYDLFLKFFQSFDNAKVLNDSVNNNLIHEQVHSVNISSVSIIDENNLDKSNVGEFVVHPIVTKDADSSVNLDMLSESNVNEPKAIVDEDDVVDSPSNPSGDHIDMDSKSTINANNLINQMSIS